MAEAVVVATRNKHNRVTATHDGPCLGISATPTGTIKYFETQCCQSYWLFRQTRLTVNLLRFKEIRKLHF